MDFTVHTRDSFGNFKGYDAATGRVFDSVIVKAMKKAGLCLHLPSFSWAVIYVSAGRFKIRVANMSMVVWAIEFVKKFAVVRALFAPRCPLCAHCLSV